MSLHRPHLVRPHRPTDRHVAEFVVWLACLFAFALAVAGHYLIGGQR